MIQKSEKDAVAKKSKVGGYVLQQWMERMSAWFRIFYKHIALLLIAHLLLFTIIGMITTSKPSPRLASSIFSSWTSNFDQSIFLTLLRFESRSFDTITTPDEERTSLTTIAFEVITSIRLDDLKSLLGYEIPGFSTYEHKVIIAGEGMDDMNLLSHESGPPLEDILQDRKAVDDEQDEAPEKEEKSTEEPVVFLYNSHSRESFLPHLPEETDENNAHHEEVNITRVSDRIAQSLEANGISTLVDDTDIMNILHEKGWAYHQSYEAARPVVEEAIANNEDIQYAFDIHRDSLPREKTVVDIDGQEHATVLFVIGAENKQYEKNLDLATKIHYKLEDAYPGLSKGIITKEGANSNGVYNQDLLENSVLIEIGGHENTLDEMYLTADIIAEMFSELYFEAEKVSN